MNQDQMDNSDGEISLLDLIYTVVTNWRLLVIAPLLAGCLALGITYLIPPTYTAITRFLPPQQQQSGAAALLQSLGPLAAGAASGLKNPADQYVSFLKSRSVQDALVERYQLKTRYGVELKGDAASALTANTRINSGKDGLISIEIDDQEPVFAAKLANAHVEELSTLLTRLAVTEAQQRRQFFENQLLQTKDKLTRAEQALKSTGVNASALKTNPAAAVAVVAQLQAQITAQEIKLASMRGYLTESAPAFKQAQAELAALHAQESKSAQSSLQPLSGDADYVARYREMKYQETLFDLFARQFELAKIDESREGAIVQVLDIAQPPERKSAPKKTLVAILTTLAVGFLLLIFLFVRQIIQQLALNPETAHKIARLRTSWR